MSTAPVPAAAPTAVRQDDYSFEKASFGGVTLVTMHGTLSDGFEGRKLAQSIKSTKVLMHLYDVRRFASWGMSEWMDFLKVTAECDLYLVECSTYAVSQLNLITGLLGHAKLVSFYASYRCSGCNEEMQTRFLIPRDRAVIPDITNSYQDCPTCGGRARLEEYPAAFFDAIAARPAFDIDDEVLAFMRSQLHYDLSPDLSRFRAYRRVVKPYTYMRLTGNVATLPPEVLARSTANTTVIDLDGVVFEPGRLTAWRTFIQSAMHTVSSLQLAGCPPGFLEAAVTVEDLHDKMKVRSFTLQQQCGTCDTLATWSVDVAANLEQLVLGQVLPGRCPSCRSTLTPVPSEALVTVLRALPARDRDVALDNVLTKARAEPIEKLENCMTIPAAAIPYPTAPRRRGGAAYVAGGLAVLLLAVGGAVIWQQAQAREREREHVDRDREPEGTQITQAVPVPPPGPTFTRPDWIVSDVPASGYCHDMVNRLMCVGVSSYRTSREDGVAEANDAALEELVNTVGLRISQPYMRDTVVPAYGSVRGKQLAALQTAGVNRTADAKAAAAYVQASDAARAIRKRVVAVLQATGGAAVPAQRADWYWEQYASETGGGNEFLVFVRYDVSVDAVRALVETYSTSAPVLDASVMTAFPGLAWQYTAFDGGALVASVGSGRLGKAGIAARDLVTGIGDHRVTDATALAHGIADAAHDAADLRLTVVTGDAPKRTVTVAK